MNSIDNFQTSASLQALRMPRVVDKTGMSRAHIYKLVKERRFPAPYKLSERVSVWNEQEVSAWLDEKFSRGGQHDWISSKTGGAQ